MGSAIQPIATLHPLRGQAFGRLKDYWTLVKSLQTGLLLITAVAGYISGCCLAMHSGSLLGLIGSMALAVSGSTVLNMAFDRDIDSCMARTARRPLPAGRVTAREAWSLGVLLTASGLLWAAALDWQYAGVVALGVVLDVVVYTIWLKRRTPFSILIGGLSGGMPVLAGRVLATGTIDLVGLLLAAGILCWIPTHIMTFSIKYREDYASACVPTFVSVFGETFTRTTIAFSTLLAVALFFAAGWLIALPSALITLSSLLGVALLTLVGLSFVFRNAFFSFVIYKSASMYMLLTMILIIAGGL